MIPDYTPHTGKLEWHITYRCNLSCAACSRGSWMEHPHTRDMEIADARECIAQADAVGWRQKPGPGNGSEPPRVVIIGGEPTLHPRFLDFIALAEEWTETYVEVFSNGYAEESRQILENSKLRNHVSVNREGFKDDSRKDILDGKQQWSMETYVSPHEAGLPLTVCYCHSRIICGIGVDASGYSLCPIGLTISEILGVNGKTRNFADLYDVEKAHEMTVEMCRHCGYEGQYRYGPTQLLEEFRHYANQQKRLRGAAVSPIWSKAFERYGITE